MGNDEIAKRFIAALSAENIAKQTRHEYHQGHPTLTDAELDMMVAAEKKAGRPMSSLAQAKKILGIPEPPDTALEGKPSGKRLKTLWLIGMALAEGMRQGQEKSEGAAKARETPALIPPAPATPVVPPMPSEKELNAAVLTRMKADRDRKVREAAPIDPNVLEWKRTSFGLPGVMALRLSQTLAQVAGADKHMGLWASDIETRARAVIRVFLSQREPNEKAH